MTDNYSYFYLCYIRTLGILIFFISCIDQDNFIDDIESEINLKTIEIYLLDTLNDSRSYCIDMIGYKNDADPSKSLQAHSCYSYQGEISVDQGFDQTKIVNEEFYITHFEVCMEAEKIEKSSTLGLENCDKSDKQKFILQGDGRIHPKINLTLCLTVSENVREGGGGNPPHLIRNLTLENCDDKILSRQKWGIRGVN